MTVRLGALVSGALTLLVFPRVGWGLLAWVILVPALLLFQAAPTARSAAGRGWWFGAGFLAALMYWTLPNIGPGLLVLAVVMGAPFALWGYAAWALRERPPAALLVLPAGWVAYEYVRSWRALGGPWGLLGASQWQHPAQLGLAALGGAWLLSFAIVACNTAVTILLTPYARRGGGMGWVAAGVAVAAVVAGPVAYVAQRQPRAAGTLTVALVQPGVVHDPATRFADSERITTELPDGVNLIVWGESSVGYDLDRRSDLVARLSGLAADKQADLLVNEDAANARGQISKSAVLIGPDGIRGRYVKTRLVPFGEYIPLRPVLGWLASISRAAGQDRVPGTGAETLHTSGGVPFGPLICFESAFPDMSRAVTRKGARVIVYQSSTSTFQDSWAPAQHAALGAVRAAETGRPAVQAALSGVSAGFDARGRRLAWLDTARRGSAVVTVRLPPPGARTPYDRYGDWIAWLSLLIILVAVSARGRRVDRTSLWGGVSRGDAAQCSDTEIFKGRERP